MSTVTALTTEVAPPPRIASYSGFLPTLRNAGLVAEGWRDAVSLAVASGSFIAEWDGDLLTPESALALPDDHEAFDRDVTVHYGERFLPSFWPSRWEGGIDHRPMGCGDASLWAPCDDTTKVTADQPAITGNMPLQVYADDTCSTWAPDLDERKQRAWENLTRHESNKIADEFWTGAKGTAAGYTNLSLVADATDLNAGTGTVSPTTLALAALQEALAQGLGDGQAGLIHATRRTVSKWYQLGALWYERDRDLDFWTGDGYLVDEFGNIIVSSGGYDGSAPDGEAAATTTEPWAYATGPVIVRLGGVDYVPGNWAGMAPDLTSDNLATIFAERAFTYELDPCTIYAIQVSLCDDTCAAAS